jgi:hypothetical protein
MTRFRIIYQNSNIEAPEGSFDIGRSLDCNLVLDDPSVSRVHATIIRKKDTLFLQDLGSRNGCKINEKKITGKVPLNGGDIITIGHQKIKIAEIKQNGTSSSLSKNTMGLIACKNCGSWISMGDPHCPSCGQATAQSNSNTAPAVDSDPDLTEQTERPALQSGQMLAGLVRKALGKNRPEEARRLAGSLMETAVRKEAAGSNTESDLETIVELFIEISLYTQDPDLISELFEFFTRIRKIIPRTSVELLYKSIRKTGYRSCSKMHIYFNVLNELSRQFTPGERFVHRRIEGLLGLTS